MERLTCCGLVVTELAHELRNIEDCVGGAVDALAGSVAAARVSSRGGSECTSNARFKRLLREPHIAVHIRKVVPALRVMRVQAKGELEEGGGGVQVALDGGARASFRIRTRVHVARSYG